MALDAELKLFDEKRSEWLAHYVGKFAVIKGSKVLGFYDTAESAYQAGVKGFGNTEFLVKQVRNHDHVEQIPALACGLFDASI